MGAHRGYTAGQRSEEEAELGPSRTWGDMHIAHVSIPDAGARTRSVSTHDAKLCDRPFTMTFIIDAARTSKRRPIENPIANPPPVAEPSACQRGFRLRRDSCGRSRHEVPMIGRTGRLAILLLLVTPLVGCDEILDIPSDLELVPSGPWRCIEQPAPPPVPIVETATVRFQACDFISNCTLPVTGLRARVCDKLDVGCNNPRSADIVDTEGLLELQVPTGQFGFDGYVEVSTTLGRCYDTAVFGAAAEGLLCQLAPSCDLSAPGPECDVPTYAPVMWFFNPPVVADIEQPISLQLYPSASLPLVVDAAGGSLAPGTGSVFMTAIDCDGQPAPGISLEIAEYEDEATALYFDSGVISNTVTETDASGVGGFIRIPPGFVEITGLNRTATAIGEVGVQASANFATYTVLVPTPSP
jgi:hypothetical protein